MPNNFSNTVRSRGRNCHGTNPYSNVVPPTGSPLRRIPLRHAQRYCLHGYKIYWSLPANLSLRAQYTRQPHPVSLPYGRMGLSMPDRNPSKTHRNEHASRTEVEPEIKLLRTITASAPFPPDLTSIPPELHRRTCMAICNISARIVKPPNTLTPHLPKLDP